jgi:Tfp pilus assembly protein PilF
VYFESGQLDLAEREWKWALAGKPENVVTMNSLGILYNKQGRYAEATAILQQAIALKPLWGDARYNYAMTLQGEGRQEEAIAEFQKAIELAPVSSSARLWYGKALIQYGDYRGAEVQLKRAVELQASHAALEGLTEVYLATGQNALAEVNLRRMLDEDKYDGDSHLKLARLLERSGRSEQAREQYEAVLVTDPENLEATSALGRLPSR